MTTALPRLSDLAPAPHEVVTLPRGKVAVHPVPMSSIAAIIRANPDLVSMLSGANSKLKISELALQFPSAALDVARHACRADNEEDRAVIDGLDAGDVLEIVLAAIELSMPGGVKGFLARFSSRLPSVPAAASSSSPPEPTRTEIPDPALVLLAGSMNSSAKPSTPRSRPGTRSKA